MKRVLKITAKNGGTTAKVRIEVECLEKADPEFNRRFISRCVLDSVGDGVMAALAGSHFLHVPLSRQRVGR
jgi:hypothetical protein